MSRPLHPCTNSQMHMSPMAMRLAVHILPHSMPEHVRLLSCFMIFVSHFLPPSSMINKLFWFLRCLYSFFMPFGILCSHNYQCISVIIFIYQIIELKRIKEGKISNTPKIKLIKEQLNYYQVPWSSSISSPQKVRIFGSDSLPRVEDVGIIAMWIFEHEIISH